MIQPARNLLIGLLLLGSAALADESAGLREYLDSVTAVTVTTIAEPLIFARERPDLAVNARDYLSLAPLEVNRAGQRECFWAGYFWSTIDRRSGEQPFAAGDQLVVFADERPIALQAESRAQRDVGIADAPSRMPSRRALPLLFVMAPDTVNYVASAAQVHIELAHQGSSDSFTRWSGSRQYWPSFAAQVDCTSARRPQRPAR